VPVAVLALVASAIGFKTTIIGQILTRSQVAFSSSHVLSPEADGIGILMGRLLLKIPLAPMARKLPIYVLHLL
jgi:hypothetical protein